MLSYLFKHKRISKITSGAKAYISQNYVDPKSLSSIEIPPAFDKSIEEDDFEDILPPVPEEEALPPVPVSSAVSPQSPEDMTAQKSNTEISKEEDDVCYSLNEFSEVKYSLPIRRERDVDDTFSKARATGDYSDLKPVLEKVVNQTFVDKVNEYIQKRELSVTSVYKAAQMDRRLFSKVMSDHEYKPSKDTAIAISLALHLTVDEVTDLLDRAGYSLSTSSKRDIVIEYFFREHIYDLTDINMVLDKLEMKSIGR